MSFTRRSLAAALLAAAGAAQAAARAAPRFLTVTIDKMAFSPSKLDARVGDVVVFVNKDFLRHTATAEGQFDIDLVPNAQGRAKLTRPGVLRYVCRYHPGMTGEIHVSSGPRM